MDHLSNRPLTVLLILAAGLAATACADDEAGVPPSTATTPIEEATLLPFVDEFDDDANGWGGPYQRFEDGAFVWELPAGQRDIRAADTLISAEDEIDDVSVSTTFTTVGIESVGIQCAYEELESSSRWYDLELARSGVTIRKRGLGTTPIETLAEDPEVVLDEGRTELLVECERTDAGYRLAIFVDDVEVLEVVDDDDPFGRVGAPNLVAGATRAEDGNEHTVHFDRFSVTPLG